MKIVIDGYEANVQQRLGSSQVAFNLIKAIEKVDKKNDYTVLLPNAPLEDMPKERKGFKYQILGPKQLWTFIALPFFLFRTKEKVDIFFSPTHYIPRFSPSKIKKIVTIFDLSFLHFQDDFLKKDLWQLTNWTKFSVENADKIVTISNFSKRDIIDQYKVDKNKITVAYPGYDETKFKKQDAGRRTQELNEKYNIKSQYIIYIGTLQPRKNLIRLIEAVSRIKDLILVIVGKTEGPGRQGWKYEQILQAPKKLGCEGRVIFTGFLEDKDLSFLLNGSMALIQPSLWEGFGIPVVEAMACGKPVLVSNTSSLPEVAGKAGLSFDPFSIDQIEQAVRTIVSDRKLNLKLGKEALLVAKKYSWEKMAKLVIKVFKSSI